MSDNNPMEDLQMRKLAAEIRKINRESEKLMTETRWYPLAVATALVTAIITITKLFL
ncbi:hypothetical protein I5U90_01170 [Stenotrophomonas maltophilia]|uniref:hypothetical protein n=1 Tax=Stenotrophomonas TaxID=40323 RepID=UPI0015EB6F8A|nr:MULTISPECIES: hypothetical protein [Stenotrophomonas maltophilia group]MBH1671665.1 hypothetical protein [Stenotrophomonas maltophilia]MCU1089726.1 hypothetical protein [Stenotrophomonas maltophilia]MCZ7843171.1 hypothetical protein [Stenotrophomonas maltophilia]HDS1635870.1 hypothetical protein [Stenotrophomonas maltophilia]